MQITLVLHNIRSTYNVGAILRTAEGLGVDEVAYSGYTPRYDDQKLLPHLRKKLNHQISKSAIGAENLVSQIVVDNLLKWLELERSQGSLILGLENNLDPAEEKRKIVLGAPELDWQSLLIKSEKLDSLASKIVLILGEEVAGIQAEIRNHCDYFLEIPMYGQKESFNVSVATAIALWELIKIARL